MFGVVILLVMTLLGLLNNDVEWAVFPGMGMVIGIYFTLSVLADGSLTEVSGASSTVIASASTAATSVWQFVSLTPVVLTFAASLIAIYKVGKAV